MSRDAGAGLAGVADGEQKFLGELFERHGDVTRISAASEADKKRVKEQTLLRSKVRGEICTHAGSR